MAHQNLRSRFCRILFMITSTSNTQVKHIIQLKKKAKERDRCGLFFTEGEKMFLEAPADMIEKIYLSESWLRKNERRDEVRVLLDSAPYETVSDVVFEYMSDTKTPQGVLCLLRQFRYTPEDLAGQNAERHVTSPLCLALEDIQDPGNLGTILRAAEGAGVTGILMSSGCVDIYNPKVIRSTMGSIYRLPFFYAEDFTEALKAWKRAGICLYAAHLKGDRAYDQEDFTHSCAFMIGNESRGLSEGCAALADRRILIPMLGRVESLNAGVASALLVFEAARQRRLVF